MKLTFEKYPLEIGNIISESELKEVKQEFKKTIKKGKDKSEIYTSFTKEGRKESKMVFVGEYIFKGMGYSHKLKSKCYITVRVP